MQADQGVSVVRGDIFAAGTDAITNPVNVAGAMGAGLALAMRRRFPDMYADYRRLLGAGALAIGEPCLWRGPAAPGVILFPTKRHWREASRWEDIAAGLAALSERVPEWGLTSLAVPALGCGLGGLSWDETRPLLLAELERVPARVLLFAPA